MSKFIKITIIFIFIDFTQKTSKDIIIKRIIMSKIIWISSFPKSGNTWMRFLIANYFFNPKRLDDPTVIKNIIRFRTEDNIMNLAKNKKITISDVAKYWTSVQDSIKVESGSYCFLKNHNANVAINGHNFTNENLTKAVIYIVRDPRDVTISASKYYNKDIDETISQIILNDKFISKRNDSADIEYVGSWKINYLSWRFGLPNIPKIIIKYEDLLQDTYTTFKKVLNFLRAISNFDISEKQLLFSIQNSSFEKLQTFENKNQFSENQSKYKFFRSGKKNQWKSKLTKDHLKVIEKNLYKEMRFFNYN